jgi:hypothetical protein
MRKYTVFMMAILLLASCKTQQLYLTVVEPAPVTIPSDIKSVGVINRSIPTDESKPLEALDKILTLEGVNLDKDGAMESVRGLKDELSVNSRFNEVKNLEQIDFRTPALTGFPVALTWEIVDKICKESGTDALFSLEKFDTDTRFNYSTAKVDMKTPLGVVPGLEHRIDMETFVKTGWRIYYPASRVILDEYFENESLRFTGRGINPLVAASALVGRKEAVNQVSNQAGHRYAMRIIPFRTRVVRDYYVKGTNNFKIAKRKAQIGKWDEAGLLWEKETTNSKIKIAGRAYYNMAIINEINGDLDSAIKWAQKSYEDTNNKQALQYVRILQNRKYKNAVLENQQTENQ